MTIAAIAVLLLPLASPLQSPPAPLDTLVDVGGYHLHMVVYRRTRPRTIVMESGGGAGLAAWSGVEAKLAERTGVTVVAYDRAGFGESGLGRRPTGSSSDTRTAACWRSCTRTSIRSASAAWSSSIP